MGSWAHVYTNLGISETAYIALLDRLYWSDQLTQQQIAKRLGVHQRTVESHFKKYKIETRPYAECNTSLSKVADLTPRQREILDGILISSGSLESTTVSARLTYGCKEKGTLDLIRSEFLQILFSPPWQSKTGYWHFKSSYCRDLSEEKDRWYYTGRKAIPSDLTITPLMLQWWIIGNGKHVNGAVELPTKRFGKEGIEILRARLADADIESKVTSKKITILEASQCQK